MTPTNRTPSMVTYQEQGPGDHGLGSRAWALGDARAASMSSRGLINSLPVRPDDADFLAADASELYRHPKEPIFLFLIVGGEGVLVHDDYRDVRFAARSRKVWEQLFDSSDEIGFLPRKFGRLFARHVHVNSVARYYPVAGKVYLSPLAFGGANSMRSTGTKVPGVRPIVVLPLIGRWSDLYSLNIRG